MQLNVRLYGTLSRFVDGYNHQSGLDITVPDAKTVDDLLGHLNLNPEGIGMIFMNGKPADQNALLTDKAQIRIFQPIFGG